MLRDFPFELWWQRSKRFVCLEVETLSNIYDKANAS